MRMTTTKKKIISYFHPSNLGVIIQLIGPPPFDVNGISYLLYGPEEYKNPVRRKAIYRTLQIMIAAEMLIKSSHNEVRNGVKCVVSRYSLNLENEELMARYL